MTVLAFTLSLAAAATYFILRGLWREIGADPDGHQEVEATHRAIAMRVVLFVMALQVLVMLVIFNGGGIEWIRPWAPRLVVVFFGSLFIAVGNLLPRTRPNLALGIRTSRTLTDRHLWIQLHRVCGYLAVVLGVVIVVAALSLSGPAIGPVIGAAALGSVATLLVTYRRQRRECRYVTGIVEGLGGCLLLVPRATVVAVPLLVCTMAGALLVHLTVVGIGPATAAVSVLITLLVVLWRLHRRPLP